MSKKETKPEGTKSTTAAKTSTTEGTLDSTKETKETKTTPEQDSLSKGGIGGDNTEEVTPAEDTTPADGIVDDTEGEPEVKETLLEPYELELSEESPISDEEFEEIVELADRLKLSKTEAENLIKMRESSHEAASRHFDSLKTENLKSMAKAYSEEKELHTKENKNFMKTAISTFGDDPEFSELLKDPSMNYNIPLAKFLVKVGKKVLSVDTDLNKGKSVAVGSTSGGDRKPTADKFYKAM